MFSGKPVPPNEVNDWARSLVVEYLPHMYEALNSVPNTTTTSTTATTINNNNNNNNIESDRRYLILMLIFVL